MATLYDEDGNPIEIDDALLHGGQQSQQGGPQTNSDFAALRRQTNATKAAEAAAESAKREAAFLRAGIDPEAKEGMAPYFVTGYKGDLSPDAIRAAATAAGLLQAPAATPEQVAAQQQTEADLAAAGRVSGAANALMAQPTADQASAQAMADAYNAGGIEALTEVLNGMGIPRVTM